MNIIELIKKGLGIARTSKTLWLYGFFVGLGSAVNSGHQAAPPGTPAAAHLTPHALTGGMTALAIAVAALIVAALFMYFVSEGALIEGVTRGSHGSVPSVREGWRHGLAHWGVLLRIAILYLLTSVGSFVVLAAPVLLAHRLSGMTLAVTLAIPVVLVAVPWLATLYMWQAFAARIAVLENRQAIDALGKARLFLHGRLLHGLRLIVAAILGRLIVVLVGGIGVAGAGLVAFAVLWVLGLAHTTVPVMVLGALALLPLTFLLIAISGTVQSSIWTIGYLTEQQQ